jgi:hypothetical protein
MSKCERLDELKIRSQQYIKKGETREDAMLLLRQHQSHLKRSHECFFNVEESCEHG